MNIAAAEGPLSKRDHHTQKLKHLLDNSIGGDSEIYLPSQNTTFDQKMIVTTGERSNKSALGLNNKLASPIRRGGTVTSSKVDKIKSNKKVQQGNKTPIPVMTKHAKMSKIDPVQGKSTIS